MDARQREWLVPLTGIVLVLLALWMLGANEHAAAAWHRGMARPGGDVIVLRPDAAPDAALDGHRVLLAGMPRVAAPVRDPDFDVEADAPVLVRDVAMFQWHQEQVNGQASYQQDWIGHPVDSSRFAHPRGHANREPFPFSGRRFQASQVRLGKFVLAPTIVDALPGSLQPLQPDFSQLPPNLQASFQIRGGALTTSVHPDEPRLGDLRVSWLVRPLETVTVVAQAQGDRLVPAPGPDPGFGVWIGARALTDVFPDLPLPLHGQWAWRAGALVLAWLGAWLLALRWFSPRTAVLLALASGITLLGVLAGFIWIATIWWAGVIAWVVAILAAAGGRRVWRRLA